MDRVSPATADPVAGVTDTSADDAADSTDASADDAADAAAAIDLATALLAAARRLESRGTRRRAQRLARLLDDPNGMAFSLALTDQVARIRDPGRAALRLSDLARVGLPRFLGPFDRAVLRGGVVVGRIAPGLVARGVRWRLRRESAGVVLPGEDPGFANHVSRRRSQGIRLNVNLLGEAILGDDEAQRRLDDVMARGDRADVDYVSVKVSSICAQLSSLAFDRSVERISERLRLLYRRASNADPPVFVNLDMEEYGDLEMTLTVFERVLSEAEFVGIDAGIALQAYLPDSHAAFERVAAWATARRAGGGGRIKIRLVKGANLAMERVDAEIHGWPQAPYGSKAEVDASYKRLLDRALDPGWGDALRIGLGSHNIFDVAWGLVRATRFGVVDRLEFEMLEGMAPGEAEAVRREVGAILLYAPVVRRDEFATAIAYLVRRLDENTSPQNFLRYQFTMTPGTATFVDQRDRFLTAVAARHEVGDQSNRVQDRNTERRRFEMDGTFANEPDTDWSVSANRRWLDAILDRDDSSIVTAVVPLMIDGVALVNDTLAEGIDPSAPSEPLYRYALAERDLVDRAVQVACRAQEGWGSTTATDRGRLLLRCAEVLAARRGDAIAVMGSDAGKTVAEADGEVSEAIDMANYYAREAVGLDSVDAEHRPLGPIVVAPPWNFPLAIPGGGIFAALAAGNPVILKPAPESVLTAWMLANCLWDAGVGRDVLQFVSCPDDEVGRSLITHGEVAAVILTGAVATAQMFMAWRADLRLYAETSGKNAMVITAAADLDLAVKDLVRSAFGHAGQKCSAASLAIVEQSVLDDGQFLDKLADATRTLRVGSASDPDTDVGPLIRPPGDGLASALGALETGESWLVRPMPLDDHGYLWSPGIKTGVRPGSFFQLTECFGPVLGVMAARDLDHAIELQNATDYGLTGGLQSLDPREISSWLAGVEVGNAYVNRSTTGAIVRRQPFGGWKRSSVGPGAKAGGPGYVASLCNWSDGPNRGSADRMERARSSYPQTWRALGEPVDMTGLSAERNELHHVALNNVMLRIEPDADPIDVELCLLAARVAGVAVSESRSSHESAARVASRLASSPPDRVRVLGTVPAELWLAASDAWVHLDDRRPVVDGAIELRRWSREQSVSITNHRHGNPARGGGNRESP